MLKLHTLGRTTNFPALREMLMRHPDDGASLMPVTKSRGAHGCDGGIISDHAPFVGGVRQNAQR